MGIWKTDKPFCLASNEIRVMSSFFFFQHITLRFCNKEIQGIAMEFALIKFYSVCLGQYLKFPGREVS